MEQGSLVICTDQAPDLQGILVANQKPTSLPDNSTILSRRVPQAKTFRVTYPQAISTVHAVTRSKHIACDTTMSDRPSKRSRHGGERSFQDGPDRRNRQAEAGRDRDRRDRRRDDDDNRERRRYRSRSRDRQDRNRDGDRRGDVDQVRKPGRDWEREGGRDRDRDRDRGDKRRDGEPKQGTGMSSPQVVGTFSSYLRC